MIEEFLRDGRDVIPSRRREITKPRSMATKVRRPAAWALIAIQPFSRMPRPSRSFVRRSIAPWTRPNFTGFLYAGPTADGPKALEFNVRLGDPETQPLMHRMQSDFAPVLLAAAEGKLATARIEWRRDPSVCVVLASGGYPGAYETGKPITGMEAAEASGAVVFHAGTRIGPAGLETLGPRIGRHCARPRSARSRSQRYAAAKQIQFDKMHYRRDIGGKGIARPNW